MHVVRVTEASFRPKNQLVSPFLNKNLTLLGNYTVNLATLNELIWSGADFLDIFATECQVNIRKVMEILWLGRVIQWVEAVYESTYFELYCTSKTTILRSK